MMCILGTRQANFQMILARVKNRSVRIWEGIIPAQL